MEEWEDNINMLTAAFIDCNDIIYEQPQQQPAQSDEELEQPQPQTQQQPAQPGQPPESDQIDQQVPPEEDPIVKDVTALSRYYLVHKLNELKTKLYRCGVTNDYLELILKFADKLDYILLCYLSNKILPEIQKQLRGIKSAKK